MIVIGFIVIVLSMSVANVVLVRMHVGMGVCMVVVVIANLAGFVIVATCNAMNVLGRRDGELGRCAGVDTVLVFVLMMVVSVIVVVMVPGDEIRIARLPPENRAAG
jgi:hypothetical protein